VEQYTVLKPVIAGVGKVPTSPVVPEPARTAKLDAVPRSHGFLFRYEERSRRASMTVETAGGVDLDGRCRR
jgi:hypothetical protein